MAHDAESKLHELARTAAGRSRSAQAESLLGLAHLLREGDPADIAAAGDLWAAEAAKLHAVPLDGRALGDSWQSEDALGAALCRGAVSAVEEWFEEMTRAAEAAEAA